MISEEVNIYCRIEEVKVREAKFLYEGFLP